MSRKKAGELAQMHIVNINFFHHVSMPTQEAALALIKALKNAKLVNRRYEEVDLYERSNTPLEIEYKSGKFRLIDESEVPNG